MTPKHEPNLLRIHHAAISVPDIEQAIDWYRDVLGFQVEDRQELPHLPAKVAMITAGAARIEIFEVVGANALPPERSKVASDLRTHGNKHFAFEVVDVEELQAVLQGKGVEPVLVIREAFAKGFFINDCVGNLIEFLEAGYP